ncbi:Ribbon-helix-helix protein, copG family [Pleurocapsa sp. PCC 7327]|nr:Ribbon-helix-helix protein, copG family [Pleurocapsa sp. PCC 7327]
MKRKLIEKRITIGFSKPEIEKLEAYCKVTGRSYTDVIRECIRNLTISPIRQLSNKSTNENL